MAPTISILLPTFSRYANGYLQRSIDSVLQQSFGDFELLVVDDASVDGTGPYLADLAKRDKRVRHVRMESNVGLPAQTLAKAFLQSRGRFIAFNFDDTELRPDCFSVLLDAFAADSQLDFAYGDMTMHMPDGEVVFGGEPDMARLREENFIGNASVLLRKEAFDKCGWYDPNLLLKRSCDWDLWRRAFSKLRVKYVNKVLSEEYGQELPDSFRRSCTDFRNLVCRYMNSDRDSKLHVAEVAGSDFVVDQVDIELSPVEAKQYDLLCIEHYVRTLNIPKIASMVKRLRLHSDHALESIFNRIGDESEQQFSQEFLAFAGAVSYYSEQLTASRLASFRLESELNSLKTELGDLKDEYHQILRSASWRLTKPLRIIKSKCLTSQ